MKQCKMTDCNSTDMATRSSMCKDHHREYTRNHYKQNKQYYVDKAAVRTAKIKDEIDLIKSTTPCADCGNKYPSFVMDFDHLPGATKSGLISVLYRSGSRQALEAEIAKCELVCSNCHRIRTHNRLRGTL